jgi:hypothetical protein
MKTETEIFSLVDKIREIGYELQGIFVTGILKKCMKMAWCIEVEKQGFR